MWFAQAEAQFVLAGVTRDDTKFYHIIAKVDQTVLCHISDLVANPPEVDKYAAIKNRLLKRFEMSPQAKMEKLLNSCDLGEANSFARQNAGSHEDVVFTKTPLERSIRPRNSRRNAIQVSGNGRQNAGYKLFLRSSNITSSTRPGATQSTDCLPHR